MFTWFLDEQSSEFKAPLNQIGNVPRVFTHEDRAVQSPNSDTPYSFLTLDLRTEPIVLTEVESNPDVVVTYYATSETQLRLQTDSYGYGWGGYGRGGWGYYGYGVGGPFSTTTRVTEYERGTLVVDIVDAQSNDTPARCGRTSRRPSRRWSNKIVSFARKHSGVNITPLVRDDCNWENP
jgi:Domain of unknown function (DUF4136)/Protein of unknown function (DUF1254)